MVGFLVGQFVIPDYGASQINQLTKQMNVCLVCASFLPRMDKLCVAGMLVREAISCCVLSWLPYQLAHHNTSGRNVGIVIGLPECGSENQPPIGYLWNTLPMDVYCRVPSGRSVLHRENMPLGTLQVWSGVRGRSVGKKPSHALRGRLFICTYTVKKVRERDIRWPPSHPTRNQVNLQVTCLDMTTTLWTKRKPHNSRTHFGCPLYRCRLAPIPVFSPPTRPLFIPRKRNKLPRY